MIASLSEVIHFDKKDKVIIVAAHFSKVRCGCCYTITMARPSRLSGTGRHQTYLWLCSTDGVSSHITIYLMQQVNEMFIKVDLLHW